MFIHGHVRQKRSALDTMSLARRWQSSSDFPAFHGTDLALSGRNVYHYDDFSTPLVVFESDYSMVAMTVKYHTICSKKIPENLIKFNLITFGCIQVCNLKICISN